MVRMGGDRGGCFHCLPLPNFATWFDPHMDTVIHIWGALTRDPKNALTRPLGAALPLDEQRYNRNQLLPEKLFLMGLAAEPIIPVLFV